MSVAMPRIKQQAIMLGCFIAASVPLAGPGCCRFALLPRCVTNSTQAALSAVSGRMHSHSANSMPAESMGAGYWRRPLPIQGEHAIAEAWDALYSHRHPASCCREADGILCTVALSRP